LKPLIDRRRYVEDQARLVAAVKQRECDDAKRGLHRLEDELRAQIGVLRDRQREAGSGELCLRYDHLQSLQRALDAHRQLVAQRQAASEDARKVLAAASQKRAVVERLEERHRARALAEESRAEEAEIDESNARR
jgi:flagellar export protein FliJ